MARPRQTRTSAGPDGQISAFGGHPLTFHVSSARALATAGGPRADIVQKLKDLGVTDAEQLVALTNTKDSHNNLAATLEVSSQTLETLVSEAKGVLPERLAAELSQPLPPLYGLGAVEPSGQRAAVGGGSVAPAEPIASDLPQNANLIAEMSRIRLQGVRGTCVSFTLSAIHEYFRRINGTTIDYSEQFLYHEIKQIDGIPDDCGTFLHSGVQVLNGLGQCREIVWAYNPNDPCNNNGTRPADARTDAANYKLSLQLLIPNNVLSIKATLADRRPVGIAFPV